MTNDRPHVLTAKDSVAIWHAGRRAAAAGCSWTQNPFLRRENMPGVTGEELRTWSAKHDIWQRGFESNAAGEAGGSADASSTGLLRQFLDRIRRPLD